jgi:hypothetical protein
MRCFFHVKGLIDGGKMEVSGIKMHFCLWFNIMWITLVNPYGV